MPILLIFLLVFDEKDGFLLPRPCGCQKSMTRHILFIYFLLIQLYAIKEEKEINSFFQTDEGFDLLNEIGFRGVPSSIKFENRKGFLR